MRIRTKPSADITDEIDLIVKRLQKRAQAGEIQHVECTIDGQVYKTVVLLWGDNIAEEVTDWLRHLAVVHSTESSSLEGYAKTLRLFFRFLKKRRLSWKEVSDRHIIVWRDERVAQGLKYNTINAAIQQVHAFYRWAEENGFLRYRVQIYQPSALPARFEGYQFPISSEPYEAKGKDGRTYQGYRSPLTLPAGPTFGTRNTPTESNMEDAYALAEGARHALRNILVMNWAETAGGRVDEIVSLPVSVMPTTLDLDGIGDLENFEIPIPRKNHRDPNNLPVLRPSVDLVYRTVEYMLFTRPKIVERLARQGKPDPGFLFLSDRGGKLDPDSMSRIVKRLLVAVGVKKAGIHRLRAKFIVDVIEVCIEAVEANVRTVDNNSNWNETILILAKELMGHTSIMSLRPYLTGRLALRVQRSDALKSEEYRKKLKFQDSIVKDSVRLLKDTKPLLEIHSLLMGGDRGAAVAKLTEYVASLGGQFEAV